MSDYSSSQMITTVAGVAIGTFLAVSSTILYMKYNHFDVAVAEMAAVLNPTPVQAVMNKLPQVAVIGQKPGPAETTEVFIQIPGVLNMQSVYVMSDNETVISGFVIPDIQKGSGVPGGQLELPTGQPSVDPRAPNINRDKILSMTGRSPDQSRDQSPSNQRSASTHVTSIPDQAPEVVRSEDKEPRHNVARVQSSNQLDIPVPHPRQSTQLAPVPAPEPAVTQAAPPQPLPPTPVASEADSDYLKVAAISGRARFRSALSSALADKSELVDVKQTTSDEAQQDAYLNLMRSLPAIKQGHGPKQLYVMFDPNCPVCHRYYNEIKISADSGRVTVNWIPVAIFPERRSSITAGVKLLEVQDSLGEAAALSALQNMMTQSGFIERVDQEFKDSTTNATYLDQVVTNTGALVMARAETPLIVFEGVEGGLIVEAGIPNGGYLNLVKAGS